MKHSSTCYLILQMRKQAPKRVSNLPNSDLNKWVSIYLLNHQAPLPLARTHCLSTDATLPRTFAPRPLLLWGSTSWPTQKLGEMQTLKSSIPDLQDQNLHFSKIPGKSFARESFRSSVLENRTLLLALFIRCLSSLLICSYETFSLWILVSASALAF